MRRVYQQVLLAAAALSCLLCGASGVLCLRSDRWAVDGWDIVTRAGKFWEINSNGDLNIVHSANWPEKPTFIYAGYRFNNGTAALTPRRLALFDFLSPGTFLREIWHGPGITIRTGQVRVMVDEKGIVQRGPPFPPGPIMQYELSPPKPYWVISLAFGFIGPLFATLPFFVILTSLARLWRRKSRRRRGLCEACGYDLRRYTEPMPRMRLGCSQTAGNSDPGSLMLGPFVEMSAVCLLSPALIPFLALILWSRLT